MRASRPLYLFSTLNILLLMISNSHATPLLEPQRHGSIKKQDNAPLAPLPPTAYHATSPEPQSLSVLPRATTPTTYTWSSGWTVTVTPGRILMPIDLAAELLSLFYGRVMDYAGARMLANAAPLAVGVDIGEGPLVLDFLMIDRVGSPGLEWKMVYWVAAYLQGLARRGYTGFGSVTFRHESGWAFGVTLKLMEWNVRVLGGL